MGGWMFKKIALDPLRSDIQVLSDLFLHQREVKQNEYGRMGFGHCPWGDRDFFSVRWKQEKVWEVS